MACASIFTVMLRASIYRSRFGATKNHPRRSNFHVGFHPSLSGTIFPKHHQQKAQAADSSRKKFSPAVCHSEVCRSCCGFSGKFHLDNEVIYRFRRLMRPRKLEIGWPF